VPQANFIDLENKMLDQYQGTLFCVVNYNDGSFAECDIVDAVSESAGASIDDAFWLGPSRLQVHAVLLKLDKEEFLAQYPLGRTFRVELVVRVSEQEASHAASAQVLRTI
jgi:hypothetical protein